MTITDDIKKKIKLEHITPKAKWKFYLGNFAWWFLFVLLLVITSIAFGIVMYMIKGADWEVARLVTSGVWGHLILVMPRLWLAFIVITTIFAVWEFRKTKKGYRFDIITILAIVLIGSMLFGSFVYASGLGEKLDSLLTDRMPLYHGRLHQQMKLWDRAGEGMLIGGIMDINDREIIIHAPGGVEWLVDVSDINSKFEIGDIVKIDGLKSSDNTFKAITIRRLEMDRFMGGHKPPMKPFHGLMDGMHYNERFSPPPAY